MKKKMLNGKNEFSNIIYPQLSHFSILWFNYHSQFFSFDSNGMRNLSGTSNI